MAQHRHEGVDAESVDPAADQIADAGLSDPNSAAALAWVNRRFLIILLSAILVAMEPPTRLGGTGEPARPTEDGSDPSVSDLDGHDPRVLM